MKSGIALMGLVWLGFKCTGCDLESDELGCGQ